LLHAALLSGGVAPSVTHGVRRAFGVRAAGRLEFPIETLWKRVSTKLAIIAKTSVARERDAACRARFKPGAQSHGAPRG